MQHAEQLARARDLLYEAAMIIATYSQATETPAMDVIQQITLAAHRVSLLEEQIMNTCACKDDRERMAGKLLQGYWSTCTFEMAIYMMEGELCASDKTFGWNGQHYECCPQFQTPK